MWLPSYQVVLALAVGPVHQLGNHARADTAGVPAGLARDQNERLLLARQLVSSGMSWGRSYLSSL